MRKTWIVVAIAAIVVTACSRHSGSDVIPRGEMSLLAAKAKDARYKIVYKHTGSESRTFVVAQDPPNSFFDRGDVSAYRGAGGRYTRCDKVGGKVSCRRVPSARAPLEQALLVGPMFGAIGAQFVVDAPNGIDGLASLTPVNKTIAGRPARCVTLTGPSLRQLDPAATGSLFACLDRRSGVLLASHLKRADGSFLDVTAATYEAPSPSDFTLPLIPTP
jgi:hypothetical protein